MLIRPTYAGAINYKKIIESGIAGLDNSLAQGRPRSERLVDLSKKIRDCLSLRPAVATGHDEVEKFSMDVKECVFYMPANAQQKADNAILSSLAWLAEESGFVIKLSEDKLFEEKINPLAKETDEFFHFFIAELARFNPVVIHGAKKNRQTVSCFRGTTAASSFIVEYALREKGIPVNLWNERMQPRYTQALSSRTKEGRTVLDDHLSLFTSCEEDLRSLTAAYKILLRFYIEVRGKVDRVDLSRYICTWDTYYKRNSSKKVKKIEKDSRGRNTRKKVSVTRSLGAKKASELVGLRPEEKSMVGEVYSPAKTFEELRKLYNENIVARIEEKNVQKHLENIEGLLNTYFKEQEGCFLLVSRKIRERKAPFESLPDIKTRLTLLGEEAKRPRPLRTKDPWDVGNTFPDFVYLLNPETSMHDVRVTRSEFIDNPDRIRDELPKLADLVSRWKQETEQPEPQPSAAKYKAPGQRRNAY
jgi:hypothetical protein